MSSPLGLTPEPIQEVADHIFRKADELVDTDPIKLRDLAYSAARLLHIVAKNLREQATDD